MRLSCERRVSASVRRRAHLPRRARGGSRPPSAPPPAWRSSPYKAASSSSRSSTAFPILSRRRHNSLCRGFRAIQVSFRGGDRGSQRRGFARLRVARVVGAAFLLLGAVQFRPRQRDGLHRLPQRPRARAPSQPLSPRRPRAARRSRSPGRSAPRPRPPRLSSSPPPKRAASSSAPRRADAAAPARSARRLRSSRRAADSATTSFFDASAFAARAYSRVSASSRRSGARTALSARFTSSARSAGFAPLHPRRAERAASAELSSTAAAAAVPSDACSRVRARLRIVTAFATRRCSAPPRACCSLGCGTRPPPRRRAARARTPPRRRRARARARAADAAGSATSVRRALERGNRGVVFCVLARCVCRARVGLSSQAKASPSNPAPSSSAATSSASRALACP